MAPILPKRKRVERPHEIQDRPSKKSRRAPNGSLGPEKQQEKVAADRAPLPQAIDAESSDEEDGSPHSSKKAYGTFLGALRAHNPLHLEPIRSHDLDTGLGEESVDFGNVVSAESDNSDEHEHSYNGAHEALLDGRVHDASNESGDSENEDMTDPFETHFANPEDNELSRRLESIKNSKWKTSEGRSSLGRTVTVLPEVNREETPAVRGSGIRNMCLKRKLKDRGKECAARHRGVGSGIVEHLSACRDVMYGGRTPTNAEGLRTLTCLHALNHVLKTRDKVMKNSNRLSRDPEAAINARDQGFTRPKILVLLETRQMCVRYMETITKLFEPEQQENKKRFEDAFVQTGSGFSDEKPLDYQELFEGNDDNEFRLGVKFTRKTVKYYSQFYASDIILASPLGLRRALKTDEPKHADYDFLSSIEIFVVDQADAMLMQNFEHVEHVFDHLNLQPREAHGCDFSRVRQWYLDGHARYLRQTIVFSAYLTPELNAVFSKRLRNVAGKVKITPPCPGAIMDLNLPIRQTFSRYTSGSPDKDPDDRFKYFVSTIIPLLNRQLPPSHEGKEEGLGALIFIPSYLDFVRVRNHFSTSSDTTNLSFGSISEYTDMPSARRARSHFLTGRQSVLLYTGRAHHFHRYQIKGVKRVVLYGVPENPLFYKELVGDFLGQNVDEGRWNAADASARVLFSKYDGMALERMVGTQRVGRMLKEGDDTFEFT